MRLTLTSSPPLMHSKRRHTMNRHHATRTDLTVQSIHVVTQLDSNSTNRPDPLHHHNPLHPTRPQPAIPLDPPTLSHSFSNTPPSSLGHSVGKPRIPKRPRPAQQTTTAAMSPVRPVQAQPHGRSSAASAHPLYMHECFPTHSELESLRPVLDFGGTVPTTHLSPLTRRLALGRFHRRRLGLGVHLAELVHSRQALRDPMKRVEQSDHFGALQQVRVDFRADGLIGAKDPST